MQSAQIDRAFIALADPSRRAMVERLSKHPTSVKDLADPIGMALPSALKHLRVLEDGGIVESRKQGRVRTFRINPNAFNRINQWISSRQTAVNANFDRLAQAIEEFPEGGTQ